MMSTWTFLKEAVRKPNQVGAIAPSGDILANLMVDAVGIAPGQVVVELGAGTGVITLAIRRRAPETPLLVFEPSGELAALLRERFPDARVAEKFAQELPTELDAWGQVAVDRVVSGLPWTIWPLEVQQSILQAVVSRMRPDGKFVTFGYLHSQVLPGAGRLRSLLGQYFNKVEPTGVAWRNLPPAFAWVATGPRSAAE
jgi:phospholipid N-methyltransferase